MGWEGWVEVWDMCFILGLKSPQPNLSPNLNQMVEFNILFCYLFYYKYIFLVFSPYIWVIFSI